MFLQVDVESLKQALDISWKSLLALFIAMFLIFLSIVILNKIKIKNNN